jgi:hypothetical protein
MALKSKLVMLSLPLLVAAGVTNAVPGVSAATRLIPVSEILSSGLPGPEAERELARTIADFEGRTVEQVQARVAVFNVLSAGMAKMKLNPTFAGIDPSGLVPTVLTTTGLKLKEIPDSVVSGVTGATIQVPSRKVQFSLAELNDSAGKAGSFPGVHGVEIDQARNAIVLRIRSEQAVSRMSFRELMVPYSAVVFVEPKPATLQGGEHQAACTSGFSFNPDLVSTASHCPYGASQERHTGGSEAIGNYQEYCYAETQLSTTTGASGQARANTIKGSGDTVNGEYVYVYGKTTGWTWGYTGNYVSYTMFPGYDCQGTNYSLVQMTGGNVSTTQGDSGGPVFASCGCGGFYARAMITNDGEQAIPVSAIVALGFTVKTS